MSGVSLGRRILVTLLILALAGTVAVGAVAAKEELSPKRGIVIVTALLSGGLYLNNEDGTQTQVWDPVVGYEDFPMHEVMINKNELAISGDVIAGVLGSFDGLKGILGLLDEETGLFANLAVDKMTGKSVKNLSPANMDSPTRIKYGVLNCYKQTYESMLAEYGEEAEVSVFNYDWRLDNVENGRLLEEYINSKHYDEVVLTSHSMGGNVVSCYLARSQENRDKVKLYCPYAPSLLGSIDALIYIEDPARLLGMLGDIDMGSFRSTVENAVSNIATPFLRSLTSMYQLFPSYTLMLSGQYAQSGSDYMITVDGNPITTAEELMTFYKSRPWAKNEEGEYIWVFQTAENGKTNLENFFDSAYVEVDGKKVHSTTLVNTVYFAGTGINGSERVQYTTVGDEIKLSRVIRNEEGDNMVLDYSATAAIGLDADNVYVVQGGGHGNVGVNFNGLLKDKTFEEINKIWRTK